MDVLFQDAAGPVPQDDDDEDEDAGNDEEEGENADERQRLRPERTSLSSEQGAGAVDGVAERQRTLRRSISSHPRFLSEEERIARVAAAKVAAEEKRKSRPPRWTARLFGSAGRSSGSNHTSEQDGTTYQTVEGQTQ